MTEIKENSWVLKTLAKYNCVEDGTRLGRGLDLQSMKLFETPTFLFCLSPFRFTSYTLSFQIQHTYMIQPFTENRFCCSTRRKKVHTKGKYTIDLDSKNICLCLFGHCLRMYTYFTKIIFFTVNKKKWKINWLQQSSTPFHPKLSFLGGMHSYSNISAQHFLFQLVFNFPHVHKLFLLKKRWTSECLYAFRKEVNPTELPNIL